MVILLTLALTVLAFGQDPASQPRDPVKKSAAAAATIIGRVTDAESGRPLANADVTTASLNPFGSDSFPRSFRTVTNHDGRYTLTVPAGEYRIVAMPGELRATHRAASFGQVTPASGTPALLRVTAGETVAGVDISLPRTFAIEGRVVNELDEPLAKIGVRAEPIDAPPPSSPLEVRTDDRGRFRVFGLSPGTYRICGQPQPFGLPAERVSGADSPYVTTCNPAVTSRTEAGPVAIVDADLAGVDIQMQRGRTYIISGQVLDASGAPVHDAQVSVGRDDGMGTSRGVNTRVTEGTFIARGVTAGEYRILATRRARGPEEADLGGTTVRVDSTDVHGVIVAISRGAEVKGRLELEGGKLTAQEVSRIQISGRPLSVTRPVSFEQVRAGVRDDFTFELKRLFDPTLIIARGMPGGWAVRSITYLGRDITDRPAQFSSSPAADALRIVLTKLAAQLTVRVLDPQGLPAGGLRVFVLPAERDRREGGARWLGRETAEGEYDFGDFAPGEYRVGSRPLDRALPLVEGRLDVDRLVAGMVAVTLKADERRVVELRAPAGKER